GGQTVSVTPGPRQTPIYVRNGSIIPMSAGSLPTTPHYDGKKVECHLFLRPGSGEAALQRYAFDDGETLAYQNGGRSRYAISAVEENGTLSIRTEQVQSGYGKASFTFILYGAFDRILLNGKPARTKRHRWTFAGTSLNTYQVSP
ncbi:MAG: hypothetical protein KDL31_06130, partial [Kiritimatiellae bacterium]|nr:hypothetical protein [Kiritimatiellia bacterium]